MKHINFNKIVSIFILSILLSAQVFLPLSVYAAAPIDWTTPTSNPTSGLVNTLANPALIMSVISCTGIVNKAVGAITDFVQNEVNSAIDSVTSAIKQKAIDKAKQIAAEQVEKQADEALAKAESAAALSGGANILGVQISPAYFDILANISLEQAHTVATVPVSDTSALDAVFALNKQSITNAGNAYAKQKQENCLNGIAVALAKQELEKITRSTLNWVGSGFKGNPLFVQNVDSFMNNITKDIINRENKFFGDPLNKAQYPYGQLYVQSSVNSYKSQNNLDGALQQNLTNYLVPGATPQSFATDFSQGGWNGWLALTQNPQNNPLGFVMVESQATADKIANQQANTRQGLTASGGYLPQQKCTVYGLDTQRTVDKLTTLQGQIKAYQDQVADLCPRVSGATDDVSKQIAQQVCNDAKTNLSNAQSAFSAASSDPANKNCTSWNVVTPGSAIRDQVSKTINSSQTQLELVKTVNDALTYLFSALLGQFQHNGLSSLVTGPFEDVSAGFTSNVGDGTSTTSANGSSNITTDPFSGASNSSGFDITKDLAAIIKTQKDYIAATAPVLSVAQGVLSAVGQLDYCIPGPNPNWEQNAPSGIAGSAKLSDYNDAVEKTFGVKSPMQSPGDSGYLQMAAQGLAMTKDLVSDDAQITQQVQDINDSTATATANIAQLTVIKQQVDAIVAAATARRDAERKKEGLPPISSCQNTQ